MSNVLSKEHLVALRAEKVPAYHRTYEQRVAVRNEQQLRKEQEGKCIAYVRELPLETRAKNALVRLRVKSDDELERVRDEHLRITRGCGRHTRHEIMALKEQRFGAVFCARCGAHKQHWGKP